MSLNFVWTALSGFQSTKMLFLPKPPFQVCDSPAGINKTCDFVTIRSHKSHCTWAFIVRCPLAPGVWLERYIYFAQSLLLGDEPSCWKFVSTSFDIVAQGRYTFKFNQNGISAELLLMGLQPSREARPPCCILREGGRVTPLEMCIEARYPCKVTVTSHASLCNFDG